MIRRLDGSVLIEPVSCTEGHGFESRKGQIDIFKMNIRTFVLKSWKFVSY